MKNASVIALAAGCLTLGIGLGLAAKDKAPSFETFRGKPAKEAAAAALTEAERLAGKGSWELLGVARVYYLSGDKAHGQAIIDRVMGAKTDPSDWQRIGKIYAEAGENARAEEYYQRTLAANVKDDTGQSEIGAWYVRTGRREQGEELFSRALTRKPDEVWHYVRMGEAYLNVPPG